jgi:hypothetical protein
MVSLVACFLPGRACISWTASSSIGAKAHMKSTQPVIPAPRPAGFVGHALGEALKVLICAET